MFKRIKELYNYRQFLYTSVKKEFRGKYKKSFLGILWSFINPLLQLLVYALVFPYIMRVQEDNYVMFLFVALIPWNFFSSTIAQSTSVIISNGRNIKKGLFPEGDITNINSIEWGSKFSSIMYNSFRSFIYKWNRIF